MNFRNLIFLIIILFLVGCIQTPESTTTEIQTDPLPSLTSEPSATPRPTDPPEPTNIESPPATATVKVSIDEMLQNIRAEYDLFYAGSGCTATGPGEISAGYITIELFDDTDELNEIYVAQIHEGKTMQDLIDLQPGPGIHYLKPDYAIYSPRSFSFDLNNWIYDLTNPGLYTLYIGAPDTLWFCLELDVVE